jgi:hypothetical protein
MGPLGLPERIREWDREIDVLEEELHGKEVPAHA